MNRAINVTARRKPHTSRRGKREFRSATPERPSHIEEFESEFNGKVFSESASHPTMIEIWSKCWRKTKQKYDRKAKSQKPECNSGDSPEMEGINAMGNATAPASHPHHPQGIRLQPLPACLAPDDAARREHPELSLPRPGDTVVIDGGMIHFLQIIDPAQPVSAANSILWAAGMRGYDQCDGADWHSDLSPLDDQFPGLEVGGPQRIRARWAALIEHCAASRAHAVADRPEADTAHTADGR